MYITEQLFRLIDFACARKLIEEEDRSYTLNRLLDLFELTAPECDYSPSELIPETATPILDKLLDLAAENALFPDSGEQRDLFSARIMGLLTPSPKEVRDRFNALKSIESSKAATDYFYELCRAADYIRVDRIAKNVRFFRDSPCGELEITINLSKPEKDPRDIAAQRSAPKTGYPLCMLCAENPGYAGRSGFPARQNHRIVPLTLGGDPWYLQYSPYAYYDEHCIVLNKEHIPMRISRGTFVRLLDFVEQFPHYFLGSNADLPIVGGSILSHDHFQGGGYTFPMDRCGIRFGLNSPDDAIEACVLDWPMSCVVLKSADREALIEQADRLLNAWRAYTDAEANIYAETKGEAHNTVTPVARMEDGKYKLYLVLRNNLTSHEHPLGIYHPHAELHHIKKENIGLIEVMGLFILPGRLVNELNALKPYLTGAKSLSEKPEKDSPIEKHFDWICNIVSRRAQAKDDAEAEEILRDELAVKCANVLADAGVFKNSEEGDAALMRFLNTLGYTRI